ncbi:hypothetical protein SeseC_01618 [Streptococcus equi subsp. zooepidemicus ATCC 35246]|nr:hypothetical protein SeseC_01618 [Streptococcus equi subsp. zooepidemicus ATCC 35246]
MKASGILMPNRSEMRMEEQLPRLSLQSFFVFVLAASLIIIKA